MVPSTQLHVGIPFGEGGFGDTDGVFEDGTDRMWVHRNDSVLQERVGLWGLRSGVCSVADE
jgi:hypothetical protein